MVIPPVLPARGGSAYGGKTDNIWFAFIFYLAVQRTNSTLGRVEMKTRFLGWLLIIQEKPSQQSTANLGQLFLRKN